MSAKDELPELIERLEAEAYQRGLSDGLQVAETIIGWLTWKPQSKRMAQVEEWARKAIEQARNGEKTPS